MYLLTSLRCRQYVVQRRMTMSARRRDDDVRWRRTYITGCSVIFLCKYMSVFLTRCCYTVNEFYTMFHVSTCLLTYLLTYLLLTCLPVRHRHVVVRRRHDDAVTMSSSRRRHDVVRRRPDDDVRVLLSKQVDAWNIVYQLVHRITAACKKVSQIFTQECNTKTSYSAVIWEGKSLDQTVRLPVCRELQFSTCTCLFACAASYQHRLHLRSGFSALRMRTASHH